MPDIQKDGLLNSWKEIANYLGRGVRTVQRWEHMGLPVYRLGQGSRAPVIAYRRKIDSWLEQELHRHNAEKTKSANTAYRVILRESLVEAQKLRKENRDLRASQRMMLLELTASINAFSSSVLHMSSGRQVVGLGFSPEQTLNTQQATSGV